MRVIAGTARRTALETLDGIDTRPTTDRIKETLFNMLQHDIGMTQCLDLFAGSGGIGIEALSRGAQYCVFVEQNPKAVTCIRNNLKATNLEASSQVMNCDALAAIRQLELKEQQFDFIFLDPPYHQELERQVMEHLAGSKMITKQSTVIIEAALDTEFTYLESLGFTIEKSKTYKTNKHIFVYRGE